jgi:ATP-dependent RNA helicase DeaD
VSLTKGYNADALHGDLSQQQRDKVMGLFRDRSLQLLIATDVAARGIDVSNVTHVINYELPDDTEVYTHRSGRTARAGKSGISIAIVNMKEIGKVRQIERQLNRKFTQGMIPDGFQVCEKQLMHLISKVHDVDVDEAAIGSYLPSIYNELADLSKEEVIKRFTSLEFNRFLEYYRNAPDINVDTTKGSRTERGNMRQGNMDTMFMNLGSADGFDAGKMLRFICDTSGIKGNFIGRIDIKGVYSFIDIDRETLPKVMTSFDGEVFKGRKIRVDISQGGGGGGPKSSGSERRERSSSTPGGYHDRKQQSGARGRDKTGSKGSDRNKEKSYGRKKSW